LIYPTPLQKGDKVALIAPSSPISDGSRVDYAMQYIKSLGLVPVEGANCRKSHGHLAGTDAERAHDLNCAFADPEIKGVFCIRGGNGVVRLLDKIDYAAIRQNPKFFCGYSDVSLLLNAIHQQTGLVTYHTPLLAEPNFADADEYTLKHFEKYIFGENSTGNNLLPVELPVDCELDFWPNNPTNPIAIGPVCGGNLSGLSVLMGTPYELDTRGKIFFIEVVGERPQRIDRMLHGMRLAGKFEHCAGVIFGDFTNCNPDGTYPCLDIPTIIAELQLTVPVIWNFPCGHILPTVSFPIGQVARMDANNKTLELV